MTSENPNIELLEN
jgi:cardiolipin synthase A/B